MKSLEQELRDGNYDIDDVLNDETGERRVLLARMGRDVEALAGTLESDVLVALIENDIDFVEKGKDGKFYSYDFVVELEADAFTFNGDTITVDMKQIEYGRDYNADRTSDEYVLGVPEDLVDIRIKPAKVAKIAY